MEYKLNCAVLKTLRKRDRDHLIKMVGKVKGVSLSGESIEG